MLNELEKVWEKLPFDAQWHSDNELARHRDDAVDVRAMARADPRTNSPRWAPRSTSTARSAARMATVPGCGCAAASTGWNATARARLVVVDIKTGKSPVSKDDAQRHAQLAMYQLAVAEGLLPHGDEPGGGRLVYLGKTSGGGATEREQDALTPEGACGVAGAGAQAPRPRRRGRSSSRGSTTAARTARCGRCARPRRSQEVSDDAALQSRPNSPRPSAFSRPPTSRPR